MANNKYDLYGDIQDQYQLKVNYDDAKKKGDAKGMEDAAKAATAVRQRMTDNGYGNLAKQFEGYNTAQMGNYLKYYPTQGKSSFRDYLKGSKLVTEYGYTPEQIDKAIGWNNATKEITFNGMNVGKADTIVDGTSYFENGFLDGVIDNIITHESLTPKVSSTSSENIQKLLGIQFNDRNENDAKRDELWSEAKANPFETDVGKAIMADYNLKAMQGRDNEAASGAASNGGNIDSFAAANALRQQASLTAKGQQQAIAAQSARINDLRGVLGDIVGTQQIENQGTLETIDAQANLEQRDFENKETEKLNDHGINVDIANITGYVPEDWSMYFNDDGTVAPQSTLARDEVEAANALADKQLGYNQVLGLAGLESEENIAKFKATSSDSSDSGSGSESGMTGSQATTALKNGEVNETAIKAYNDAYGSNYTVDNPPAIAYSNLDDGQKPDSDGSAWDAWYDEFENEKVKGFLTSYIKPYYDSSTLPDAGKLKDLILEKTADYDIGVEDARKIMSVFGLDSTWLEDYRDRWGFNSKKGMIKK